jgi:hypothetical protein
MSNIKCNYCESEIIKYNLSKHQKSETCIKIKILLDKQKNKYESLLNEKDILLKNLEDKNKELLDNIIKLNETNNNMKNDIKILEKSSNEYRKIVEKAATKSTNTTVKNNNYNNNYLNYISTEPIKFSDMKKQLKNIVNNESVMYNDEAFHNHIVDNILKDNNGKDKILCTDINRKNFTYKDESSGKLISDPELDKLRDQLRNGMDIKLIRRNLLNELVDEYEDNGRMGIDPYQKFSEYINKLNFGTPFVDHVAKKTYIKTKTNNDNYTNENDINNVNNKNYNSIDYDDYYDEEEFKKLEEEFGNEI